MLSPKLGLPKKILLFENDGELRNSLRRLLEREGFAVTLCSKESGIIKTLSKNEYCLMIFGLNHPKDISIKLLNRIATHKALPKTIILSSFNLAELQPGLNLPYVKKVLTKPIKKETLLYCIENIRGSIKQSEKKERFKTS